MKIKNKIIEIIKNKTIWILCIMIFLIITYIIVENSTFQFEKENENEIEELEEIEYNEENNITLNKYENIKEEIVDEIEETESIEENDEIEKITDEEKIYVYITGEVNKPGVVILINGSRISDAIEAAGGITENADIMKVNLVYMLKDGMKVNIPSNGELKNNPNFEYITMGSGDEKNDDNSSDILTNINSDTINKNESAFKISNVNINTATQTELETLPGIGPSIALKIINYRKENGKFTSIEELKNVSGIGESKYEEVKKYIYV